jgi:hypothetical protein
MRDEEDDGEDEDDEDGEPRLPDAHARERLRGDLPLRLGGRGAQVGPEVSVRCRELSARYKGLMLDVRRFSRARIDAERRAKGARR